jgi:hypothetical protein
MLAAPTDTEEPDFRPADDSPAIGAGELDIDDDWFDATDYAGAFADDSDDWADGWTAFPAD